MPVRRSGTEASLKRQVMKMLAAEFPAAVVRKRHGTVYTTAGDPDLMILFHGIHIECELKRPGEEPTLIQRKRLDQWFQAGAWCAVISSVAEMRAFMASVSVHTSARGCAVPAAPR